jgi:LmbE family N-acetylglucosaminyl deacetylase
MTAGDCGSTELGPAKIANVRRREAARAAKQIHARYTCLEEKDLLVFYNQRTLRKVLELVRRAKPALVLTHSPVDYMVDHETTSRLCQTACFGATAPNFKTTARRRSKPLDRLPHLYYAQPFGGRDILGNEIRPSVCVDITTTIDRKEKMLACHKSQQAWLRAQQGVLDTLSLMRQMATRTGELCGLRQAEGFRQHLGQGFPQDNLLCELLGGLVRSPEN